MAATGARNTPFSLLGGDVVVTGNVAASVDLHIDGRIEGDLSCAGLVQGQDSVIKGHVTARTARIGGAIEGSITVDTLVIEASARITGDINYETITVEQGAQIDGRMNRKPAAGADLKLVSGEG